MLEHRTNLLLTKEQYKTLKRLSKEKDKTVSNLIREAINKTYDISKENSFLESIDIARKEFKKIGITKLGENTILEIIKEERKYE